MKIYKILLLLSITWLLSTEMITAQTIVNSEEVSSMQVYRASSGTRIFRENDGIEEMVIRKVVEWINSAPSVKETAALPDKITPIAMLKIQMKTGDDILLGPAYDCHLQKEANLCTLADGDVILIQKNQTIRLRSVELFDWLLTGWKQESTTPPQDTKEMMVQDIVMLLIGPEIDKAVGEYYSKTLTYSPTVYPYQVDIVDVERIGGFRSFQFELTVETTPVVGPHITVGKDRLTFEIAPTIVPGQIKLKKYEHLETHELPPHWQDILKK